VWAERPRWVCTSKNGLKPRVVVILLLQREAPLAPKETIGTKRGPARSGGPPVCVIMLFRVGAVCTDALLSLGVFCAY
jgi:hypothetical protein